MRTSRSALCGRGGGGVLIDDSRRESKWEERVWRPGSMLIEGFKALMKSASFIPRLTQSCSDVRTVTSSWRKWWPWSRACCSMADLYLPRALEDVDLCSWKRAFTVLSVSPTYLPGHGVELAPAQGMWYT